MSKLRGAAARTMRDGFAETLAYTEFPPDRWSQIRTSDGIERINREIRRKTRVVGTFPDGNSAHAGDGEAEVHSGARAGQEEAPGYVESGRDGRTERKVGGLEEDGAEDSKINLQKNLDGTPPQHSPESSLMLTGVLVK